MSLPICECGHESFSHYSRCGASHCCVSSCLCERFNEPAAAPTATLSDAAEHVALREHLADCPPSLSIYPDAAERRRYAMLQAAACLHSWGAADYAGNIPPAVDLAEQILAEIERREKEGK